MLFQNSLIAHLCVMNKSDTANKNFEAFINPMETTNTKYDKVIALTEDPDSIVVVFVVGNRNKVKFIHNLKKFGVPRRFFLLRILIPQAANGKSGKPQWVLFCAFVRVRFWSI